MSYTPTSETEHILRGMDIEKKLRMNRMLIRIYHYLAITISLASIPLAFMGIIPWYVPIILIAFAYAIEDLVLQKDHAVVRIYGPVGRLRYIFEAEFRDKYLQYFNETDKDGRPIPRIVRNYVYQKAHGVLSLTSFGTELDTFDINNTIHARLLHSNFGPVKKPGTFEVEIGTKREGVRPFIVHNTLNVSAMSYGSINRKAAETISIGAKGVAYVNTGEGGYGPHGVAGNDVVFQIGSGKFGVGDTATLPDGTPTRVLNEQLLSELVRKHDNIKMIQLKISQGAKPGIGGHLPGSKVTPEIAAVRKIEAGKTVISPTQHAEIVGSTTKDVINNLLQFINRIRKLTELPVGIKFCFGKLDEVEMLVEAMRVSGDGPDAIQIDGADGGTGAGPNLYVNYVGYGSALETMAFLDNRLKFAGIRDRVTLSASGKFFTPAHAAVAFAVGADYLDTARGALLSLGCIQSLKCHTNECPTGITTNMPWRMRGLDIEEKSVRIRNYFAGFHHDMMELTAALGHSDPRNIERKDMRLFTQREKFARHFEEDPFGMHLPTTESLIQTDAAFGPEESEDIPLKIVI
jgi:glutamate synthase domain-containing protein 2